MCLLPTWGPQENNLYCRPNFYVANVSRVARYLSYEGPNGFWLRDHNDDEVTVAWRAAVMRYDTESYKRINFVRLYQGQ